MDYQDFMINFAPKIFLGILLIWFLFKDNKKNLEMFKTHIINMVFYIGIYFLLVTLNIIPPFLNNIAPSFKPYAEVLE